MGNANIKSDGWKRELEAAEKAYILQVIFACRRSESAREYFQAENVDFGNLLLDSTLDNLFEKRVSNIGILKIDRTVFKRWIANFKINSEEKLAIISAVKSGVNSKQLQGLIGIGREEYNEIRDTYNCEVIPRGRIKALTEEEDLELYKIVRSEVKHYKRLDCPYTILNLSVSASSQMGIKASRVFQPILDYINQEGHNI